jgi:hypothetical protein
MLPQLSQQLLTQWPAQLVGRRRPSQLRFLGLRTRVGDGYALFLAFADADHAPCLAVKVAREPGAESRLKHEWDTLHHFRHQGAPWLVASLPAPILWTNMSGTNILATTAPAGQPIRTSPGFAEEHFARVGDWLAQLARATHTSRPMAMLRQKLEHTAEQLGATFELSKGERMVVEGWVNQWLAVMGNYQATLFAAHGNLYSQNIWEQREHLAVVNWEQSELADLPLRDIFTFMTTYHFPVTKRYPKERYLRTFQTTYLTDGPQADLACQTITRYCRSLDLPLEAIEASFGLFLTQAALHEYDQLQVAANRGYLPLVSPPDRSKRPPYQQAIKDQLWINLLRMLIQERHHFKPNTHARIWQSVRPGPLQQQYVTGKHQVLG